MVLAIAWLLDITKILNEKSFYWDINASINVLHALVFFSFKIWKPKKYTAPSQANE
jgi:hypothetical protein